ncbi:flagellar biosynthetic protein FliO [Rhizobiales bacterium]|nr:flagellar biosynthetic protein FliO [Hongsoonwoonella zoysiae]
MDAGFARGVQFFIAVLIVLALIAVFVWILRRITGSRMSGNRNRQPRIAVMDATGLDARRRLVLIRRDNVEHLLLIGGPSDVVVEQNIVRGVPVSANYPRPGQPAQMMPEPSVAGEPATAPLAAQTPSPPAPQATTAQQQPPRPAAKPQRPEASQRPTQPLRSPAAPQPSQQRAPSPGPQPPQERPGGSSSPQRRAGAAVAAAGAAVAHLAKDLTSKAPPEKTAGQQARPPQDTDRSTVREPHRSISPPSSGPAASARSAYPQRPQQEAPQPPRAPATPPVPPRAAGDNATSPRAEPKMSGQPGASKPSDAATAAPPVAPERPAGPDLDLTSHLEESLRGALDQPSEKQSGADTKTEPELRAVRKEPKPAPQREAPEVSPQKLFGEPAPAPSAVTDPDRKATAFSPAEKKAETPRSEISDPASPRDQASELDTASKGTTPSSAPAKNADPQGRPGEGPAAANADVKAEPKAEMPPAPKDIKSAGDTGEPIDDRKSGETSKEASTDAAPEAKKNNDPVTIDAIEEEMAKLLNEISGNRNK